MITVTVSTHSRLKAAAPEPNLERAWDVVSTHSRLKAADICRLLFHWQSGFNTQPPEGG